MSGATRPPEAEALPVRERAGNGGGAAAPHAVPVPIGAGRAAWIWRAADGESPTVGEAVLAILERAGPGRPLPGDLLAKMELALGASFGAARIHTDSEAAEAADELDARAFTVRHDIYFGAGQYDPGSGEGRDLLAHELAHTLQPRPFSPAAVGAPAPDPLAPHAEEVPEVAEPVVEAEDEPGEEPDVDEEAAAAAEEAPPEPEAEGPVPPAGEGAAPPEGGEGGEEPVPEGGRSDVELLMPPPPTALSPAAQERLGASQAAAGSAATSARSLPTAEESTAEARGAVTEPEAETTGRAESALAEALATRPEPSPEIVQLCEDIRESIRAKRPVDEDELVDADPEEAAQEAGGELNEAVEGDTGRVEGEYAELQEPQEGTPALEPTPVAEQPSEVPLDDPHAAAATPDPVAEEDVSLDADVEAADQDIEDAGMTTEPAQLVEDGPIAEAREARGDLGETARQSPAEVLAEQDAALAQASADMAALQEQALSALTESRSATVAGVGGQQTQMVGSEEQIREQVSTQARQIFTDAQTRVRDLLQPLPETAMEKYNAGVGRLKTVFRQKLDRVKAWIEERHSGVGGAILGAWDALTGLPGWVTDAYDEAEQAFGDGICDLITEISTDVNAVVAACEAIIEDARSRIADLFSNLPDGLQEWAAAEQARLNEQLDGLHGEVMAARDSFNEDMSRRAVQAVRAVQDEIAKLREEAKGLIGKIADAIAAFIEDPAKFIIEGLLKLVGIDPAAFWRLVDKIGEVISDIADDPMRFVNNLVAGIGQGFQQFFDNFPSHLLQGFFDWLFGGLGSVGVQLPSDFSLKSIITFILQLLGLTWDRIREILVRHIGEENVALIEKAWELVSTLMEQGPEGIFEMIKERLDPAQILSQILDAAIQYVVETLIKQVTVRVIALFNPAGAIVQAIELIYKVLKWVFENAARIFSFVETIVNGMADVLAGNISGVASAVEQALAKLIPPVIDFLAGLLGLGDLPDKVVEVIKGLQDWILGIVDKVVAWLVAQGKKLLEAVGLGGPGDEEAAAEPTGDNELGTAVTFAAGGESHRQWVEMHGTDAVLMVASTPETVEQKLARWRGSLTDKFKEDKEARKGTEDLIRSAEALLGQSDQEADRLVAVYQANKVRGAGVPEIPNDDKLEAKQRALTAILMRLFQVFGETGEGEDAEHLVKIAAAMPGHSRTFVGRVHPSWYDVYISKVDREPVTEDVPKPPSLWPESVLAGTDRDALAYADDPAAHQLLVDHFTVEADRERRSDTGTFFDYVFGGGTKKPVRPTFLQKAAAPVVVALRSSGMATIDALPDAVATKKWRSDLKGNLAKIAYSVGTSPYGRFDLPEQRIPDHHRFKPKSVITFEQNGVRFVHVLTEAGQTFEVEDSDIPGGMDRIIHGRDLRLFHGGGRGAMRGGDPEGFEKGMGMNRAHIVADLFGGSGYKEAANLIATSAQYNQGDMRDAEREVAASVVDFANGIGVPVTETVFDITVQVTFGDDLLDARIIQLIKAHPDFPTDNPPDVESELKAKVAALSSPLRRVLGVTYSWRARHEPSKQSHTGATKIGPDLLLLLQWKA